MSYKIENSKYQSSAKRIFSVIKKRISFRKLAIKHHIGNASLRVSGSALDWSKCQSMISKYSELRCRSVQTESEEFIIG